MTKISETKQNAEKAFGTSFVNIDDRFLVSEELGLWLRCKDDGGLISEDAAKLHEKQSENAGDKWAPSNGPNK